MGANSFEGSVDLSAISDNVFHMQLELTNFAGNMQEFNAGQRTSTGSTNRRHQPESSSVLYLRNTHPTGQPFLEVLLGASCLVFRATNDFEGGTFARTLSTREMQTLYVCM